MKCEHRLGWQRSAYDFKFDIYIYSSPFHRWDGLRHAFLEPEHKEALRAVLGFKAVPYYVVFDAEGGIAAMGDSKTVNAMQALEELLAATIVGASAAAAAVSDSDNMATAENNAPNTVFTNTIAKSAAAVKTVTAGPATAAEVEEVTKQVAAASLQGEPQQKQDSGFVFALDEDF